MNGLQRLQVFSIAPPPRTRRRTKRRYRVRWRINGRDKTRAFKTRTQATRRDAPAGAPEAAAAALSATEARLGRQLTAGQRNALEQILTSGRGVELVVGIAGAGKTTALAAAREAFEAAGYQVVGTSTSGQAARTVGREAGIPPSRTLASLNWRIAHDRLRLSEPTWPYSTRRPWPTTPLWWRSCRPLGQARAKVVAVGDPRQLGAVGPGGGFEVLVARFGDAVHVLDENVRQRDPNERLALERPALRAGGGGRVLVWRHRAHRRVP